jgi:rhombotail lipoprotein
MTRLSLRLLPLLGAAALASGCAAGATRPSADDPTAAQTARPSLERSLFSRDSRGSVTEEDLQRILAARVDLDLPARVGVVALENAFDPEQRASVAKQAIVAKTLTRALDGSPHFSALTDVSTELPSSAGLEGLRTIAARYRARYLLLVNTVVEDRSHLNNWAWLYATGVGLLLAPGQTVATEGLLEASLFDVKSGTVLYTVREPFQSRSVTWLIGGDREHGKIDGEAITQAAESLAKHVGAETEELARWAARERQAEAATVKVSAEDARARP